MAEGIVNGKIPAAVLEANRAASEVEFTQWPEFRARYDGLSNESSVQGLINVTGIQLSAYDRAARGYWIQITGWGPARAIFVRALYFKYSLRALFKW